MGLIEWCIVEAFLGSANIGYNETKKLGENLDNVLESTQMKKYMFVDSKYKIGG
jgi:hypothetical protein